MVEKYSYSSKKFEIEAPVHYRGITVTRYIILEFTHDVNISSSSQMEEVAGPTICIEIEEAKYLQAILVLPSLHNNTNSILYVKEMHS